METNKQTDANSEALESVAPAIEEQGELSPAGSEEMTEKAPVGVASDAAENAAVREKGAESENAKKEKKTRDGAKKRRISKQLLAVIIGVCAVLLILAAVLITGLLRDRRPPELDSVRERVQSLVEASFEVNDILFGEGLPTYPRVYEDVSPFKVLYEEKEYTRYYFLIKDEKFGTVVAYNYFVQIPEEQADGTVRYAYYDILTKVPVAPLQEGSYRFAQRTREAREGYLYHNEQTGYYYYALPDYEDPEFIYEDTDDEYYDYVRADSAYRSIDDIKAKADQIYSAAYLTQIYENLFTGVAFSEGENGVLYARYRDYEEDGYYYLQKSNIVEGMDLPERRYDYSTMKMAKGSKAKYILIEMESYIVGEEENRTVVTLAFALENGNWFLDSPSY